MLAGQLEGKHALWRAKCIPSLVAVVTAENVAFNDLVPPGADMAERSVLFSPLRTINMPPPAQARALAYRPLEMSAPCWCWQLTARLRACCGWIRRQHSCSCVVIVMRWRCYKGVT